MANPDETPTPSPHAERLQKVLAAAGVGSRRDCEVLILEGRVEVDGEVVTALGTKVDPDVQSIRVDGELLKQKKRVYFALNKPMGVVTTNDDPSGRTRVIDLVPDKERVFPVGRLDRASEGLIVVTNDGELAFRLTHPKFGVEKEYLVRIAGSLSEKELDRLRRGIHLSDGLARVVSLRILGSHKQSTDLEIVLREGKNREIRRILARVGHKVLSLKRVAIGPLKLGDLQPGEARKLSDKEVKELLTAKPRKAAKGRKKGVGDQGSGVGENATGEKKKFTKDKGPKKPFAEKPPKVLDSDLDHDDDELLNLDDFLPGGHVSDDIGGGKREGAVLDYGDEEGGPPKKPFKKGPPRGKPVGGKRPMSRGQGKPMRGDRPRKFGKDSGDRTPFGERRSEAGRPGGTRPPPRAGGRPSGGRPGAGSRPGSRGPGAGRPGGRPGGGRPGGRPGGDRPSGGGGRPGGRPGGGRPGGRPGGGRPGGGRPGGGRSGGPRGRGGPRR